MSISELWLTKIREFQEKSIDGDYSIQSFLNYIAQLEAIDALKKDENSVTVMTVHCAKGLEYPAVFIAGCEENLFPHSGEEQIEEERRLFYVALTRAKDMVIFTRANQRPIHARSNKMAFREPSRFLKETKSAFSLLSRMQS